MSDLIQRDDAEWQMLLNNAHSMVESLTNKVEARDALIESLQRENEERVKAHNEIFDAFQKSQEECDQLKIELESVWKSPAITPEMRERIQHVLKYKPYTTLEVAQADLLRELNTGGEG